MLRIFINYRRVFQVSKIEHSDGPVGSYRSEHVPPSASPTERNVVYFFVVRDKLRLDVSSDQIDPSQNLASLQTPNCTSRVDTRRPDEVWVDLVPVERSKGRAEVRIFIIVQDTFQPRFGLSCSPHAQIISGRSQQVRKQACERW